jgi:1-acyl-sn-glycerol-3-phosphate acyltransferase
MIVPRLNRFGRALPVAWQHAIVERSRGLDLGAIASDLFLDYPPDERGLDVVTTKRQFFIIKQIVARYFRTTTMGAENIPDGRVMIVASHSGVVPWDAILLVAEIYRLTGRFSWNAGHEFWGRSASVKNLLVSTGMVLGGRAEFEALLCQDEICTIFADAGEGNRHAYYLESDRYKVKPEKGFAPGCGGYIKVALRTRSPIVPVAIVGAEEVHYCLGDIPQLAEYLKVPFFPLIASLLPLPARIYMRFGEAIRLPAPPEVAEQQAVVDRLNEQVRAALQALIDDTLRRRKGIYWSSYDAGNGARLWRRTAGRPIAPSAIVAPPDLGRADAA